MNFMNSLILFQNCHGMNPYVSPTCSERRTLEEFVHLEPAACDLQILPVHCLNGDSKHRKSRISAPSNKRPPGQMHPTCCDNIVAICCVDVLGWFGWGFTIVLYAIYLTDKQMTHNIA